MRPTFGANWRTAADVKSAHDHLSRHHAARKSNEHGSLSAPGVGLRIGFGTSPHAPDMPAVSTANRRREPGFCRLPPRATAGLAARIIAMAVRDHASLVTHRNRNLART